MNDDHFPGQRLGTALIVSGPSGTGKSTVCKPVMTTMPDLHFSVSCTTRSPRPGEQDGVDYFFITTEEFQRRLQADAFLEHAEVHGNLYGTPRSEVEPYVVAGRDVLLDIDVQGARQVRQRIADTPTGRAAVFVFIAPPSLEELERRLRGRQTETEAAIQRRLSNARDEMAAWLEYDYLVINDQVEAAGNQLRAILLATHCQVSRRR